MAILTYLLYLVLFLFPFGELLRFDLGNSAILKPIDVAVGISVLVYLVLAFVKKPQSFSKKNLLIFGLFPLSGMVSLLINITWLKPNDLLVAALYLVRWIAYASLFFIAADLKTNTKKKVIIFLLIDGFLIELVGFLQYFLYPGLRNLYYLGWDEHLFRIFSVFLDPNFSGAFFVLYFIFIAGLLYEAKTKKQKRRTILLSSLLAITLIALFLTFSRSALIMLVVSAAVFLTLIQKKKLLLWLVGILVVAFAVISPLFYIENLNLFRTASSEARVGTYENALKIIGERPIFGVGFDAYRYAQIANHFRLEQPPFPSHADAGVDNSFLFALATTGIVGLAAYIYLWYMLLQKALVAFRKRADIFALISLASAVGLFVDAFFINSLFYPAILVWIWIVFGFIESK